MQASPNDIILLVIIITLVFLVAGIFLVSYIKVYHERKRKYAEENQRMKEEYEKQLLKSLVEVQETTFSSLGKELHDNIGQLLSTTKMLLGLTERNMDAIPDTFSTASATLSKAIHELRALSKTLNKEWLEQFSFIENIMGEASRMNTSELLKIHIAHEGEVPIKAEEQIILFRIVQEAIQNTIKHAQATNMYIDIRISQRLVIKIEDDGSGFNTLTTKEGVGLLNMKHRSQLLGGSIHWHSSPAAGTKIIIELPIKNN